MQVTTRVIARMPHPGAESERRFYRAYNNLSTQFGGVTGGAVELLAGQADGTPVRGFCMLGDFYRIKPVMELFEDLHSVMVLQPEAAAIGYIADGNDIDAAPQRYLCGLSWLASPNPERDWWYFSDRGLYLQWQTT